MSEIKGQLLGLILTVAIFAAVGTVLVAAFQSTADNVSANVSAINSNSYGFTNAQASNAYSYTVNI